jgi:hypothetical protein
MARTDDQVKSVDTRYNARVESFRDEEYPMLNGTEFYHYHM